MPDSFKGSLSSKELCDAIEKGVLKVFKNVKIKKIPIADGGEGSFECIKTQLKAKVQECEVNDPLLRKIKAGYLLIDENKAFIEMARASGLHLLSDLEKNPLKASSYGTGELIKAAVAQGIKELSIALGGSATSDCGIGMLSALGFKFFDKKHKELEPLAKNLIKIAYIDEKAVDRRLFDIKITIICDVKNPLYGKNGSCAVYGPQKGLKAEDFELLEKGFKNFAFCMKKHSQKDIAFISGVGAAGGLGAPLLAFFDACIQSGIDYFLNLIHFEKELKNTSLIITGEGSIDSQSIYGKAIFGIVKRAKKCPVVAIVGQIKDEELLYKNGIAAIMSVFTRAMSEKEAIENASKLVTLASYRACNFLKLRF